MKARKLGTGGDAQRGPEMEERPKGQVRAGEARENLKGLRRRRPRWEREREVSQARRPS